MLWPSWTLWAVEDQPKASSLTVQSHSPTKKYLCCANYTGSTSPLILSELVLPDRPKEAAPTLTQGFQAFRGPFDVELRVHLEISMSCYILPPVCVLSASAISDTFHNHQVAAEYLRYNCKYFGELKDEPSAQLWTEAGRF